MSLRWGKVASSGGITNSNFHYYATDEEKGLYFISRDSPPNAQLYRWALDSENWQQITIDSDWSSSSSFRGLSIDDATGEDILYIMGGYHSVANASYMDPPVSYTTVPTSGTPVWSTTAGTTGSQRRVHDRIIRVNSGFGGKELISAHTDSINDVKFKISNSPWGTSISTWKSSFTVNQQQQDRGFSAGTSVGFALESMQFGSPSADQRRWLEFHSFLSDGTNGDDGGMAFSQLNEGASTLPTVPYRAVNWPSKDSIVTFFINQGFSAGPHTIIGFVNLTFVTDNGAPSGAFYSQVLVDKVLYPGVVSDFEGTEKMYAIQDDGTLWSLSDIGTFASPVTFAATGFSTNSGANHLCLLGNKEDEIYGNGVSNVLYSPADDGSMWVLRNFSGAGIGNASIKNTQII
jgi:hypothetical protein